MKNNFENALAYIAQLKEINPTALQDDKVLASAFMSYSEKTNKPTKKLLRDFSEKFLKWQRHCNLFDKQLVIQKPISFEEFIIFFKKQY